MFSKMKKKKKKKALPSSSLCDPVSVILNSEMGNVFPNSHARFLPREVWAEPLSYINGWLCCSFGANPVFVQPRGDLLQSKARLLFENAECHRSAACVFCFGFSDIQLEAACDP